MIRKLKKGFTLVELVVVIAVIAILAAVSVVSFTAITNKAKVSHDNQIIDQVNISLKAYENLKGKPKTMHEALDSLKEDGFLPANFGDLRGTAKDYTFAYSLKENKFVALKETSTSFEISYPSNVGSHEKYELWKFAENLSDLGGKYSYYLRGDSFEGSVNVSAGFDVGDNTGITEINYSNTTELRTSTIVIRSNSSATTLNVNGYVNPSNKAQGDVIAHYGEAGALKIEKCATGSYHENGKVGFAEINTGRIVLESQSDVDHIHINAKDSSSFDEVIIKDNGTTNLPDAITRDEVSLSENSSVDVVTIVSTTDQSEVVKAYGSSASGSTQKTESQNTTVDSPLGQLVLDNGASSDKALDESGKDNAKDEYAADAASAEFVKDEDNDNYVARIGKTGYLTFSEAIEAANASASSVTVSILKDIQQSGSLLIRASVVIKGGNHVFTTVGTATSGNMAAFDICDLSTNAPIKVSLEDLTINSTKHARVVLLNADYPPYNDPNVMDIKNVNIVTDGEALYSNGPALINARSCTFRHEGQYLSGEDAVYYSALIVGYNGTLNVYDSLVSSFGNGAATFPSGGTINLYNTKITAFDDFVDASTGYVFWARHEKSYDTGDYKDYCGSAIINVYSGEYAGPYRITDNGHTSANRDAQINIFGGKYAMDPTEYVEAGHSASQNSDGSWTVQ